MKAIIDGFNAPLTAGAFIDLSSKNFYSNLPINRAEEFFVLQTGDPVGDEIGFIDPETNIERHVPLEIRICLLYTSPSPRDLSTSRMPSSA